MSDESTINDESGHSLAAEYVLGVLDAPLRRAAERRIAEDSAFAAEVAFWEERLGGLANEVMPVTPPRRVWSRINTALTPRQRPANLWNSLQFWRWSALASAALAAACLAVIYVAVISPSRAPLVATLDASGQTGFLATVDPGHNSITIVPASLTTPDQRALELWLIAPGDQPRSLGLIEAGRPVRINVPADLVGRVRTDAALAVSIEPPGGSPTGAPTGPVIASGKLTNL
jgi:anti-sigma-K factor RskA